MSLVIAWVVFPLVLAVISLGSGLLLDALSGVRLPRVLVVPAGFAVVVVAITFATAMSTTAPLATPLVVAVAVAGFAWSIPLRRAGVEGYAIGAAVAVFAAFAAPIVLSGDATFAGYIKLDDTSSWLALTDGMLETGRSVADLAPSSYSAVLRDQLPQGYPVGAFVPLGVGAALVGEDGAWVFQPYLAFLGALLALALYALASSLVRSPRWRFLCAFVAAQPALLYAYTLWGGVKEIAAAALLATLGALLTPLLAAGGSLRAVIPAAVVTAALLSALSLGGVAWLAPILVPALVLMVVRAGRVRARKQALVYLVFATLLTLPVLASGFVFIAQATAESDLTRKDVLGNLFHSLSILQLFGIWPIGDFRLSPERMDVTSVLILVVVGAALIGGWFAWRERAAGVLIYAVGLVTGAALFLAFASPWVEAKALATASSAPLLLGMVGAAVVFASGRQVEAVLVATAIAGGVLCSNALAFHEVTLAPRGRLAELQIIGDRFEGDGPTLLNEYSPYGARHFLRNMDAEGPSERRVRRIPLRTGLLLQPGNYADLDEFQRDAVLLYRTIVLRRSPTASRPPTAYRLVWSGRFYEVWQRPDPTPAVAEHVPLGGRYDPAAVPRCADVHRLAARAGSGGWLAAVPRPPVTVVQLAAGPYPASLQQYNEERRVIYLRDRVTLSLNAPARSTGWFEVWLGGSFLSALQISVDGRALATRRHELNWPGYYSLFGRTHLRAGLHRLTLSYHGPDLRPGSGGHPPFGAGPLVLSPLTPLRVTYVPAARARSLCGKRLDWVEALRG